MKENRRLGRLFQSVKFVVQVYCLLSAVVVTGAIGYLCWWDSGQYGKRQIESRSQQTDRLFRSTCGDYLVSEYPARGILFRTVVARYPFQVTKDSSCPAEVLLWVLGTPDYTKEEQGENSFIYRQDRLEGELKESALVVHVRDRKVVGIGIMPDLTNECLFSINNPSIGGTSPYSTNSSVNAAEYVDSKKN